MEVLNEIPEKKFGGIARPILLGIYRLFHLKILAGIPREIRAYLYEFLKKSLEFLEEFLEKFPK